MCLNDEVLSRTTVIYKNIEARSIPGNIQFDTPEVFSRRIRDITKVIDLKTSKVGEQLMKLPGEVMSADDQCAVQYGLNFRQCSRLKVSSVCYII